MLQVQGAKYEIGKTDITYHFAVRLGTQEWFVDKQYKDFQKLAETLTAKYGAAALPRLTGVVYIKPLSDATGLKRLPKLEDYITSILTTWKKDFKNPQYFEVPNPKGSKHPPVPVEMTMAQFLEFEENYDPDENDDEDEANGEDPASNKASLDVDDDEDASTTAAESGEKNTSPRQPKPPAAAPPVPMDLFSRLTRFYQKYKPENADRANVEKIIKAYAGKEETLWGTLIQKYGPEPVVAQPAASLAAATTTTTASPASPAGSGAPAVSPRLTAAAAAAASANNGMTPRPGAGATATATAKTASSKKKNSPDPHDGGFELIEEDDTFDSAHVLSQCRTMSSEVDVIVKDYVIHQKEYVAYNFQITFAGYTWLVTKRFSEFNDFHTRLLSELKSSDYANFVPPLDDVQFPSWRKNDPDVAELRSVFMTNFFKIIAPMVDEWFDIGYLTHFRIRRRDNEEVDSLERYASAASFIKVSVNRMLFEFFDFSLQIEEFNASQAEKVAKENEKMLPQFMQKSLEQVRKQEEEDQRIKNLAYRRSFMEQLSASEFSDLLRILHSFDDDRHALGLLEYFVKNGYYYPAKSRYERVQELDAAAAINEQRQQQQQQRQRTATTMRPADVGGGGTTTAAMGAPTTSSTSSSSSATPLKSASKWGVVKDKLVVPGGDATSTSTTSTAIGGGRSMSVFDRIDSNNSGNRATTMARLFDEGGGAPPSSSAFGGANNSNSPQTTQSNFYKDSIDQQQQQDNNADDFTTDIFDQMGNSAMFGQGASITDFTTLVTTAVKAAKDQLRGRAGTVMQNQIAQQRESAPGGFRLQDQDPSSPTARQQQTTTRYDKVLLKKPCGVTSTQLAKIAAAIPFNDSRAAALAVLSPILLDDDHLDEVFATLIYDWKLAEKTLLELLSKKEAPEGFQIPAAPLPM